MFFSVPMIDNMLTKGYTNALNFEHTYYLDKNVVELMLNISGFNIERDYFISTDEIKDWCLFASCSVGNQKEIAIEKNLKGVKYFQQFLNINNNIISDLNKKLKKYKNAKKFIFGAHIFTQFLLNFGLKNDFLYVLDNDNINTGIVDEIFSRFRNGYYVILQSGKELKDNSMQALSDAIGYHQYSIPIVRATEGINGLTVQALIHKTLGGSRHFDLQKKAKDFQAADDLDIIRTWDEVFEISKTGEYSVS